MCLLIASNVLAFDEWTTTDTSFQLAGSVLWAVEALQTIELTERDEYWETNPVLGRYPNKEEVALYFTGAIIAGWVIAYVLPKKVRPYFQGFWIGTAASSVWHNYRVGLRIQF